MHRKTLGALLVGCLLFAGCATPYQEEGGLFLGGVRSVRIDEDTLQVSSRVNSITDPDVVQHFLLRKCAEETLKAGYDLFIVGASRDRSKASTFFLPGSYSSRSSFVGNTLSTNALFTPAQAFTLVSPGESVFVKMGRGRKSAYSTAGVFDAREVLKFLAASTATSRDRGISPSAFLAMYPDDRPAEIRPSERTDGLQDSTAPVVRQQASVSPAPPAQTTPACGIVRKRNGVMKFVRCP